MRLEGCPHFANGRVAVSCPTRLQTQGSWPPCADAASHPWPWQHGPGEKHVRDPSLETHSYRLANSRDKDVPGSVFYGRWKLETPGQARELLKGGGKPYQRPSCELVSPVVSGLVSRLLVSLFLVHICPFHQNVHSLKGGHCWAPNF